MSARFELDEARAAEWLAQQVAAFELWENGDSAQRAPELEIGTSYDPRDYTDEGYDTSSIVYHARETGLITGPGIIDFDYYRGGDASYAWIVSLDGPGQLQITAGYRKIGHLGDGGKGAAGALSVLTEAVGAANGALDGLDAYVAAREGGDTAADHDRHTDRDPSCSACSAEAGIADNRQ